MLLRTIDVRLYYAVVLNPAPPPPRHSATKENRGEPRCKGAGPPQARRSQGRRHPGGEPGG